MFGAVKTTADTTLINVSIHNVILHMRKAQFGDYGAVCVAIPGTKNGYKTRSEKAERIRQEKGSDSTAGGTNWGIMPILHQVSEARIYGVLIVWRSHTQCRSVAPLTGPVWR